MSTIKQEDIIAKMAASGLVPVFNHTDHDVAREVLDACYAGGIRVFEFTNRGHNALEVFEKLASHSAQYPDLILGIGTIFSAGDAEAFLNIGARSLSYPRR